MSTCLDQLKMMLGAGLIPPHDYPTHTLISFAGVVIVYIVIAYLIIDLVREEEDLRSRGPGSQEGPSGMSFEEVLQQLPMFGYRGSEASKSCPICLETFKIKNICRILPVCRHIFHSECIDPWLLRRNSCPVCRSLLVQSTSLKNV